MLLKNISINEFKFCYKKLINFFSNAIVKLELNILEKLKENMVQFDEVKEANLGFSYDSNVGCGLTGKTTLSVLHNINKFTKKGLFGIEDFAEISLFDKNVNGDRITDMILNIIKNDFIIYSCRIAQENNFPIKQFNLKQEYNFNEMRWEYGLTDIPYIIDENGKEIPVFLLSNGNRFISEPKISKFVHILFDARIKDAGFNVNISPETNAGNGPVDFKISRGDDKVLIENKISSNPKLLECIDENKQIHTYLKQEECKDEYLVVFINKESDVDKINVLIKKASQYTDKYNIYIKDVDCIKRENQHHIDNIWW